MTHLFMLKQSRMTHSVMLKHCSMTQNQPALVPVIFCPIGQPSSDLKHAHSRERFVANSTDISCLV